MRFREIDLPLVVIVGPTAVGKTEISIQLAERLNGEIVSADSRLFYCGMDIGTAKPTQEERQRVPHHLIDVAEPDEVWSLAIFQQAAYRVIGDIHVRQRLPFLVGGTGQYVRAIIEGWEVPAQPPDERLRSVIESWADEIGKFELHRCLEVVDPQAAGRIDPHNLRRTIRALEVIFLTGRRFSEQRRRSRPPYSFLLIGLRLPRPLLFERINGRIESMIANGLVDEVRLLLSRGNSPELPNMSAIGYREITACLKGELTLEEATEQMKRSTRQFVRRQANWFKESDTDIQWFEADETAVDRIEELIRSGEGWVIPESIDPSPGSGQVSHTLNQR